MKDIMLASTIGPVDSGIIGALEAVFEKKTGLRVKHIKAGTGEALNLAKSGGIDLVIVHAKALEEKFVADGYGIKRIDLMYNDFVIMGSKEDPAGIRGEKSVLQSLKKIASSKSRFVSRGDHSGTHEKELELWKAAGIEPQNPWYQIFKQGASGNAPTLLYTDAQSAYTVIDRATYITLKEKVKLVVLIEGDELLLNYITVIPCNPQKLAVKNPIGAGSFISWLISPEVQSIIRDFGKEQYGEPLFFPNTLTDYTLK